MAGSGEHHERNITVPSLLPNTVDMFERHLVEGCRYNGEYYADSKSTSSLGECTFAFKVWLHLRIFRKCPSSFGVLRGLAGG